MTSLEENAAVSDHQKGKGGETGGGEPEADFYGRYCHQSGE